MKSIPDNSRGITVQRLTARLFHVANAKPWRLWVFVLSAFAIAGWGSAAGVIASGPMFERHDSIELDIGSPVQLNTVQAETRQLKPGETVTQAAAGAYVHIFRIQLEQGQYLRTVVEQRGIDVTVSLYGPANQQIIEMDSPNGKYGPESVSVTAQSSGNYSLRVSSNNKWAPAGVYELRAEGPREPTQADATRIAAERAFAEARKLRAESRQKAVAKYAESLSLWRDVGDVHGEAYTLCALGMNYRELDDLPKAKSNFEQARSLWQMAKNGQEESFVLNEMAVRYRDRGDPSIALAYYQDALKLRRSTGDRWGQAQVLNNFGLTHARMGKYHQANEAYAQALALYNEVGDRFEEARTRNNLAGALRELGEAQRAFDYYQELLLFLRDAGNRGVEAYVHNNIGEIYDSWGDSSKALEEYETALALFREVGQPSGQVLALDNIGALYVGWGDPQRALDYFHQSPEVRKQVHDLRTEANTYSLIAYTYELQGEPQKALQNYEEARKLREAAKDSQGLAYTLLGTGTAYNSLGESQKALDYCQRALRLMEEVHDVRGQAIALNKLGHIYTTMRESAKATDSYVRALTLWEKIGEPQGEATSLYGIARVERDRDKLPEAREQIDRAINIVESLRAGISSGRLRINYLASKQDYYQLGIDIRMRLHQLYPLEGHDAAALNLSERARARGLLDILGEARANIDYGSDSPLAEKILRLERQLEDKGQSLVNLRNLGRGEDAAVVEKEIKALTTEYEEVRSRMKAKNPAYAALTQPPVLSLEEIRKQLLDDETVLLEYVLGEERSYVWAVSKTSPLFSRTLPKRAEIERVARRVRDALTVRQENNGQSPSAQLARIQEAERSYQQSADELSVMVLEPVASQLGTKRLLIVPDGVLRLIPFEALPAPDTQGRRAGRNGVGRVRARPPLIITHEIAYEPSASTLALLRTLPGARPSKSVAVLADPVFDGGDERIASAYRKKTGETMDAAQFAELSRALRSFESWGEGARLGRLYYSRQEALDIMAATSANKGRVALSFEASRQTAMSPELSQYSIVHFATHAIAHDEHPELSGIILSLVDEQGRPQNGFLQLHDIYNMRLNCNLVVLSACQTAIGKEVRGEGLLGLSRGLMYAGTSRVVASLWAVDDKATAELMKRFYIQMFKGQKSPAAALRAVKTEMLGQRRWRAPYYWAGFVLQGEWK
jgi:CHAT domain-containing protein/Tfp pilus assembly protein PilF